MSENEMIYRIGDAIFDALEAHGDWEWLGLMDGSIQCAGIFPRDAIARAAIEAMREPNLSMRKVCTFEEAEITWPAMIDAALRST